MKIKIALFDLDNTLAHTASLQSIRESADYDQLTADILAPIKSYGPVPKLLEELKGLGVRIGIVTNAGARYAKILLEHLEISKYFDVVVTYTDVKAVGKKPSPVGIQLALSKLGAVAGPEVVYVGDDDHDIVAAYRAGVTPVLPAWASRKAISTAPAIELSSQFLIEYVKDPGEFVLFAEKSAKLGKALFTRKGVYFLPLDSESNVVTVRDQMSTFCLGRYFSQRGATTVALHDTHSLSKAIEKKSHEKPFTIPNYWPDVLAHVVTHGPDFMFKASGRFDIVTVVPGKQGQDQRLERLLIQIQDRFKGKADVPQFLPDALSYLSDARSQKTLHANERRLEAERALNINPGCIQKIVDKKVLVIDDVITTGSTMARAMKLLRSSGANSVIGLALAKTVSLPEDERACPKCGRSMVIKKNKKTGERFFGCTGFGDAENQCSHAEPVTIKACPKCQRAMRIQINSHTNEKFWGCTGYRLSPKCGHCEPLDSA